mmetsp:Transcript_41010/g.57690  ORF Transcript_41010/g.57690 Transcript_41010/m.57690 type:complete len:175 (-) Transcript_41010:410-934(-)|eukprot:CAMPEP_0202448352 /NCGR_PEP_ID=MMETSP1360-20130828/7167_1 /ASSEMBLY_ACC=CAM_ASM_000848 /TAXON_ID=515479 /ORGANISM="Licmophora paradoxa, Strain CCMP2313" /LENGTH=174 /DNA_ID=CAMNT_0049065877 /DNA_START=294 /DNA_END=818 /DNA_ORIENTATION=+
MKSQPGDRGKITPMRRSSSSSHSSSHSSPSSHANTRSTTADRPDQLLAPRGVQDSSDRNPSSVRGGLSPSNGSSAARLLSSSQQDDDDRFRLSTVVLHNFLGINEDGSRALEMTEEQIYEMSRPLPEILQRSIDICNSAFTLDQQNEQSDEAATRDDDDDRNKNNNNNNCSSSS